MMNDTYTTEEFVAKIAKLIETIPRDIEGKEISAIINDALANYIAEDDTNVVFFSKIIANCYINFLEEYTEDVEEYHIVVRIVTDFKVYIEKFIQDLILKQLKNILLGGSIIESDEFDVFDTVEDEPIEILSDDFMNEPQGEE